MTDNDTVVAELWKHRLEKHPNGMPYGVENFETFYVIEREAEITTEDGYVIPLNASHFYSFNGGFGDTWKTLQPSMEMFVVN